MSFELYLNGILVNTITNITTLTKLSQSTSSTGYIVPFTSSFLTNQVSANHVEISIILVKYIQKVHKLICNIQTFLEKIRNKM